MRDQLTATMSLDATTQPTRQALAIPGRSGRNKVTGKLKVALEAMVFQAMQRKDAAQHAGLTDHALYYAFRKPHVKAFYFEQLDVLRTSAQARALTRLIELSDQSDNLTAAVAATRTLLNESDQEHSGGTHRAAPGLVVQIINSVGLPHADRKTEHTTQVIDVAAQPPDRSDDGAS